MRSTHGLSNCGIYWPTGSSPSWPRSETPDWVWFEQGLAYDNARLFQALIATGSVPRGRQSYVAAGIRSLRWLMSVQTAPSGVFRPVGSKTFGDQRQRPRPFDQQRRLRRLRRLQLAWRHGAPEAMQRGAHTPSAPWGGSSAAMTFRPRSLIWRPGAAATACTRAGATRTAAESQLCRICWAWHRCAHWVGSRASHAMSARRPAWWATVPLRFGNE